MPLYMDLHKASDYDHKPTVDDIKKNHIADLAVQHKHGVRFIQYWINEEAGMVFCLMEAPDKEACAAVHAEAHGGMPCNIIELKGGDYTAVLNESSRKNAFDIVENLDGTMDTGYRTIMVVQLLSFDNHKNPANELKDIIVTHQGHLLQQPGTRHTIVFPSIGRAMECAENILEIAGQEMTPPIEIKISISAGLPVTEGGHLFAEAVDTANVLCDMVKPGKVILPANAYGIMPGNKNPGQEGNIQLLNNEEEQFCSIFLKAMQSLAAKNELYIDNLVQTLHTSRSQLYRDVKKITGLSPNAFIQEWRLQKAAQLIRQQYGNITQVAMEAGFNNLSYFAKGFQQRFGLSPLKAAKQL